jgi:hypothetical protein
MELISLCKLVGTMCQKIWMHFVQRDNGSLAWNDYRRFSRADGYGFVNSWNTSSSVRIPALGPPLVSLFIGITARKSEIGTRDRIRPKAASQRHHRNISKADIGGSRSGITDGARSEAGYNSLEIPYLRRLRLLIVSAIGRRLGVKLP